MERICWNPGHVDQPDTSIEDNPQPRWKIPGKEREQGVDGELSCLGRRHCQSQCIWKNLPPILKSTDKKEQSEVQATHVQEAQKKTYNIARKQTKS